MWFYFSNFEELKWVDVSRLHKNHINGSKLMNWVFFKSSGSGGLIDSIPAKSDNFEILTLLSDEQKL